MTPTNAGALGTVYKGHDTQLDRQVALKVPHFQPEHTGQMLQRFHQEARAASTATARWRRDLGDATRRSPRATMTRYSLD